MRRRRTDEASELAALADGSLARERAAGLEARVVESPDLAGRLAEQQHAVALFESAAADVTAPAALRVSVDAKRRGAPARSRPLLIGVAATAALGAALVIGFGVFGSGASGERFHTALAPTGLVPAAIGSATLTKTASGWRIELRANGLPRLEDGRFYEAWLRNGTGVLVPVGTFNDGRNVTLWAGVSPKDFTTLTVTRERADGDQASSGQKVLVGTVDTH